MLYVQKDVETHRDLLRIAVPVRQAQPRFTLAVNYQGCADKGLCYPPMASSAALIAARFTSLTSGTTWTTFTSAGSCSSDPGGSPSATAQATASVRASWAASAHSRP